MLGAGTIFHYSPGQRDSDQITLPRASEMECVGVWGVQECREGNFGTCLIASGAARSSLSGSEPKDAGWAHHLSRYPLSRPRGCAALLPFSPIFLARGDPNLYEPNCCGGLRNRSGDRELFSKRDSDQITLPRFRDGVCVCVCVWLGASQECRERNSETCLIPLGTARFSAILTVGKRS